MITRDISLPHLLNCYPVDVNTVDTPVLLPIFIFWLHPIEILVKPHVSLFEHLDHLDFHFKKIGGSFQIMKNNPALSKQNPIQFHPSHPVSPWLTVAPPSLRWGSRSPRRSAAHSAAPAKPSRPKKTAWFNGRSGDLTTKNGDLMVIEWGVHGDIPTIYLYQKWWLNDDFNGISYISGMEFLPNLDDMGWISMKSLRICGITWRIIPWLVSGECLWS